MKVFALSDLHLDYEENLLWLNQIPNRDFQSDVLILAGDITSDLNLLAAAFAILAARFRKVLFVPGNHEFWLHNGDFTNSLEKFNAIMALCRDTGICDTVYRSEEVTFVPLLGWYDYSFAKPDNYLRRAWRDYRACAWPPGFDDCELTRYFLDKNEEKLNAHGDTLISFSHFLPRIDLMPDRIPPSKRRVYPVLGCQGLGRQVETLKSDIHVYGHSHVNRHIQLDGTLFINNAFGYPSEAHIALKALRCIFDTEASAIGSGERAFSSP
ncbi:MAG: metallophosphoesterase [Pseudohongiellaceae bacterium]